MGEIEIFQNVTDEELRKAEEWYDHLREPEKPRVSETLNLLYSTRLNLHGYDPEEDSFGNRVWGNDIAVIVAGTSIGARNNYHDIDLFLLTERSLSETWKRNIWRDAPHSRLMLDLEHKLPEYVYLIQYMNEKFENRIFKREGINPKELVKQGVGAIATVSLFYDLEGFQSQRPGRSDDLLEPVKPQLDAEDIIIYNKEKGAKFLVLMRQYEPSG